MKSYNSSSESDASLSRLVNFNLIPYQVQVCQAAMKENTVSLIPHSKDSGHSHHVSALLCQIYFNKIKNAQIIYVTRKVQAFQRLFNSSFKKSNLTVATPEEIQWHDINLHKVHLVVFDHVQMENECFAQFKTVYRQLS